MSEEAETTSIFHHLQRDVNTECDLLFEMAGGMMMSPPRPRMNFYGEEALFLTPNFHTDMGGGMMMSMSPSRINYFSPPSGDSIGNFDPFRLWNFADHSDEMMMRSTWKQQQQQPCIEEVDAASGSASGSALGQNQSLGILLAALEAESRGETVRQSCCWGSHPQPQTSDDYTVNNVDECFQLAGGLIPSLPMMNYSLPSDDSLPLAQGRSFELYRFWDDGEYSVGHELHNRERIMKMTVSWNAVDSEVFPHKELWWNIDVQAMEKGLLVAHSDVHLIWKCKYTTFSLIDIEVGMRGAWIEQKSVTHPPITGQCGVHSSAVLEFLANEFGDTSNSLQPIKELQYRNSLKRQLLDNLERLAAELEKSVNLEERLAAELAKRLAAQLKKSNNVRILLALLEEARRMTQLDSPCEAHIPKSSATNEETNNVVELVNNSIDAKDGNSSSHKTDTISRWEKDHGITHQVLQQLFGKSRDAAAKTLKVSTSTFKRACRNFGINRWPNHQGKMPNNQKQDVQAVKKHKGIQPCPALPPLELEGTNTSECNSTVSVKVTYKNDTIRFPLSSSSTIKYLEEQLETKFKISLQNMSIKYQDEEDEWITLMCDSGLMHGLDVLRSSGKTVIRMMVTPKFD